MCIPLRLSVACAILFLSAALPVRAQSLGDLARKEAERRKTLPEPAKVLTNDDVPDVPQPDVPPPSDLVIPTADSKPDEAGPADQKATEVRDEKYWGDRMKALQTQLDTDEFLAKSVQSRINALTADFVNRDDPAQRAVIANDRQRALDEADRLNKAIDADKKALADFEEEARGANVPAGWLR